MQHKNTNGMDQLEANSELSEQTLNFSNFEELNGYRS